MIWVFLNPVKLIMGINPVWVDSSNPVLSVGRTQLGPLFWPPAYMDYHLGRGCCLPHHKILDSTLGEP